MNSSTQNPSSGSSATGDSQAWPEEGADDMSAEASACALPQFYCAEGYDAGQSTGYLMRQILSNVSSQVTRELEPSGLTNAQWVPMLKLRLGRASTVAELARECRSTPAR